MPIFITNNSMRNNGDVYDFMLFVGDWM